MPLVETLDSLRSTALFLQLSKSDPPSSHLHSRKAPADRIHDVNVHLLFEKMKNEMHFCNVRVDVSQGRCSCFGVLLSLSSVFGKGVCGESLRQWQHQACHAKTTSHMIHVMQRRVIYV